MDDQQQLRLNEAADQFTSALMESYRAVSARGEAAQEQSAQLTQEFFNRVINNLHTQAEDARQMTQQLADQQQRAREAGQALTQESVGTYMDFVNSMFSFWQGGVQEAAERGTAEAQRITATAATLPAPERGTTEEVQRPSTTTEAPPEEQATAQLPLEDYDSLTVEQISQRLDDLSAEEVRQLRAYEAENKSRSTLLQRLDERIEAGSSSS